MTRPADNLDYDSKENPDTSAPIFFWAREGFWPPEYFQPPMDGMGRMESILARKRSHSSTTTATIEDLWQRGYKNSPYRDPRYEVILAGKGIFTHKSKLGITSAGESLCRSLLEKQQTVPKDSLFRDDIFETTYWKLSDKNEARVIQDISRLIVPSPETFAAFGAEHLSILAESVDEGWINSIPFTQPRPQPNFSVDFKEEAFTKGQLAKLSPFIGDYVGGDQSFMATYRMFFPFLTCEVKCATSSINIADRQNAHSAAVAVQAVVKLFEAVQRKNELHRQILAFSVSHDNWSVRIYGHYPVFDGNNTEYYSHAIQTVDFEFQAEEKWTSYRFSKNVYDDWMPAHLERIRSAIDQLPAEFPRSREGQMQPGDLSASLSKGRGDGSNSVGQGQAQGATIDTLMEPP